MVHSKENSLTDVEIEKLILNCKSVMEKFVIITLIYSGMRVGELQHMRKTWVNFVENKIVIPLEENCTCCANGKWSPKTKAGARSIPITDARLQAVLRGYFAINEEVDYTGVGLWKIVRRVASRAGIEHKVYPHALRATFASIMAHKISSPSLMYVMGWSRIRTAEEYIRPTERRAFEEISKAFDKNEMSRR